MFKPHKCMMKVSVVCLAVMLTASWAGAEGNLRHSPDEHRVKPDFPDAGLKGIMKASEALGLLEDRIPEMAAFYGFTPLELREVMTNQRTLWVDTSGKLFFVDDMLGIDPEAVGEVLDRDYGEMFDDPIPLDQAFNLHSSPGSSKTILLDFDGHVIPANSAWAQGYNSGVAIDAPAWNIDGDINTFGADERAKIIKIWRRVAEDFAAFDVNVTTAPVSEDLMTRDSSSDTYYGTRVLISPISYIYGNAGGVAYLGVFDYTNDYYKPALVFPEKLANAVKYIAEAASHEAGHNLGLYHDGKTDGTEYYTGQGNWAPIMGVGYYKSITQWSKGEYADANNSQDDYVVMASNGLVVHPDDHGDVTAEATPLNQAGNDVSGMGVIESPQDRDVFIFTTGAGAVDLSVMPGLEQPNLDIEARLLDSFGNLMISSDLSGLSAGISTNLPAGNYYLMIDGVGYGEPVVSGYSDYGSLGQYTISGTVVDAGGLSAPVAVANAFPVSGITPFTVQLTGSGSSDTDGVVVGYHWDFGDGTSATAADVNKTYQLSGDYTVRLTVTDDSGLTDTASLVVTADNRPPVASMTASTLSGIAPLVVDFDGIASSDPDGTVSSYSWDMGDGNQLNGSAVQHIFFDPGTFTVTLTVTDNKGAQDTDTVAVTVEVDPNVLNAPSNLSAAVSAPNVTLNWTDTNAAENGYSIERSVKPKGKNGTVSFSEVGVVGANVTVYSESVSDDSYLYRVRAFNDVNVSGYSAEVTVNVKTGKGGGGPGKGGGNGSGKGGPKK